MEIFNSLIEILGFIFIIGFSVVLIEIYLYFHFKYFDKLYFNFLNFIN